MARAGDATRRSLGEGGGGVAKQQWREPVTLRVGHGGGGGEDRRRLRRRRSRRRRRAAPAEGGAEWRWWREWGATGGRRRPGRDEAGADELSAREDTARETEGVEEGKKPLLLKY